MEQRLGDRQQKRFFIQPNPKTCIEHEIASAQLMSKIQNPSHTFPEDDHLYVDGPLKRSCYN